MSGVRELTRTGVAVKIGFEAGLAFTGVVLKNVPFAVGLAEGRFDTIAIVAREVEACLSEVVRPTSGTRNTIPWNLPHLRIVACWSFGESHESNLKESNLKNPFTNFPTLPTQDYNLSNQFCLIHSRKCFQCSLSVFS